MKKYSTSLTDNRFGKWGWSIIIYVMILNFFYAALTTDGQNLFPTFFAEVNGWNSNTLLAVATPAGIIGIIGNFVFSRVVIKVKAKTVAGVTMIVTGICFGILGLAPSIPVYFVAMCLVCFFASGFGLSAQPVFMAHWFPKKKGIALGWSTMGAPFSSAFFVSGFSILFGKMGLTKSFLLIGVIVVILGIISFFWAKDYPEEVGAYPDNMPPSETESSETMEAAEGKSQFTLGALMKDKDMWLISIGFGLMWMTLVGILSQFIPRMLSVGYDQSQALFMLTVVSIIAIPGSYFWGWLDSKIGTKKASFVFAFSYVIALVMLIASTNAVVVWIGCIFAGFGVGGLLNLLTSMVISVYGRMDFVFANSVIVPIASVLRVLAFLVVAVLLQISQGSYTLPYIVFIVIDIIGACLILLVTNECKGRN